MNNFNIIVDNIEVPYEGERNLKSPKSKEDYQ